MRSRCQSGAPAPEIVRGDAQGEEPQSGNQMLELVGIAIGQKDWVRDDGSGGEDEKKWRDRVAQYFVGERDGAGAEAPMRTAERKMAAAPKP